MNPTRVRASNYRTFSDLDLELPEGLAAVIGENGAGKSSIVNLVDVALFGPQEPFRTLADYLTADGDDTEVMVELTFEHAGELYRARRGYSARGQGKTTLDLEKARALGVAEGFADDWESLTLGKAKETQDLLERTIGQTRATFRASSFLAQGDGGAFTEAKPAERQAILADALGLDIWAALKDLASRDRRASERTLDGLTSRLEALRTETDGEDATREEAARVAVGITNGDLAIVNAEKELERIAATVAEAEARETNRRAAKADVDRAHADLTAAGLISTRANVARAAIATADAEISEHVHAAATLDELMLELAGADAQRERRRAAEASLEQAVRAQRERRASFDRKIGDAVRAGEQARQLRASADSVVAAATGPDAHVCDRCAQTLGEQAAATAAASYRAEADALDAQVTTIDEWTVTERDALTTEDHRIAAIEIPSEPDDHDVRDRITAARTAAQAVADARARIAAAKPAVDADTPEHQDELGRLSRARDVAESVLAALPDTEPVDLDALRGKALTTRGTIDALRRDLDNLRAQHGRLQERLNRIDQAKATIIDLEQETTTAQADLDVLLAAEKAYGKDGIPALIVEAAAIPQIEQEANRYLDELGTSYRVELRTQRALKTGDGVADTLDIVVIDAAGSERDLATFSGGEKTRIGLALRIALAKILAHRRGASSRLLAIDEPDGLDEAGMERLRAILHGLESDFDRILLVSHVPALRDSFENVLEVVKVDGRSRVIA